MVLGDSLSSAYGMPLEGGWVALLGERLASHHPAYRVVNLSISGETTRGARARLPAALAKHRPDIVIVELGGNDGLRGFRLDETRKNLNEILRMVQASGAQALLVGMQIPPNYGPQYVTAFRSIYAELAQRFSVPLVPFLLAGVADQPERMQADGIHPRAAAQPLVLDNVWLHLAPMLAPP
jgi:acyl-CoA thioesterase-1